MTDKRYTKLVKVLAFLIFTLALSISPILLFSQDGDELVMEYSGSNLVYIGRANPIQPISSYVVGSGSGPADASGVTVTLTSIVDAANTSTITVSADPGWRVGHRICVSGASDVDLNACYVIATTPLSTTATITTANVTDTTYNNTGLKVVSAAPRTTMACWNIQKFYYSGSAIINTAFADSISGTRAGVLEKKKAWSLRATYAY